MCYVITVLQKLNRAHRILIFDQLSKEGNERSVMQLQDIKTVKTSTEIIMNSVTVQYLFIIYFNWTKILNSENIISDKVLILRNAPEKWRKEQVQ